MALEGILLPLTTPLEGDRVTAERLAGNIARYLRHGVTGFLLLGSTGEAPLLEEAEKVELMRAARAAVPSEVPLLVGVGLESTGATCRLSRVAAAEGATAVLVVTPSYFRGAMTEDALVRHYAAVADASPVPVLLYNVPAFTGVVLPVGAVARLAKHPNVAGLKDSSGDLAWTMRVLAVVPERFRVLSGSASTFLAALAMGAHGAILAMADVLPEAFVAVYRSHREGRGAEAAATLRDLLPAIEAVAGRHGTSGVKAAMGLRGLYGGAPRPPLAGVPEGALAELRKVLASLVANGRLAGMEL